MRKLLLLFCLILYFPGCISYGPSKVTDFGCIQSLQDIEGVYQNRGEREQGTAPIYLSAIIWPNRTEINHSAVTAVEVTVTVSNTITVRALREDGIEKEDTFVEGKDFELRSGRVRLKRKAGITGLRTGEPLVGSYLESVELGLDTEGHGKYKQQISAAGLAYLVIPVAVTGSDEVKFVRIGKMRSP